MPTGQQDVQVKSGPRTSTSSSRTGRRHMVVFAVAQCAPFWAAVQAADRLSAGQVQMLASARARWRISYGEGLSERRVVFMVTSWPAYLTTHLSDGAQLDRAHSNPRIALSFLSVLMSWGANLQGKDAGSFENGHGADGRRGGVLQRSFVYNVALSEQWRGALSQAFRAIFLFSWEHTDSHQVSMRREPGGGSKQDEKTCCFFFLIFWQRINREGKGCRVLMGSTPCRLAGAMTRASDRMAALKGPRVRFP
jgi:hypothetical protein